MANHEESNPLLTKQPEVNDEKKATKPDSTTTSPPAAEPAVIGGTNYGWTADGLPVMRQGSVVGEPLRRAHWDSSLFACLGRNDEFCSSDLEVCKFSSQPIYVYFINHNILFYIYQNLLLMGFSEAYLLINFSPPFFLL